MQNICVNTVTTFSSEYIDQYWHELSNRLFDKAPPHQFELRYTLRTDGLTNFSPLKTSFTCTSARLLVLRTMNSNFEYKDFPKLHTNRNMEGFILSCRQSEFLKACYMKQQQHTVNYLCGLSEILLCVPVVAVGSLVRLPPCPTRKAPFSVTV